MIGRLTFRLGVIGALAVVLLLPGCGRKGPLDPPPASRLQPGVSAPGPGAPPEPGMKRDFDENGRPIAAPGHKKRLFLDWLLD